jgi:hypothetical protein
MSECYVVELSQTTAEGKLTRALQGYHASHASLGYLPSPSPPAYPPRPEGTPASWPPPPMPVRSAYASGWRGLLLIADLWLKKYPAYEHARLRTPRSSWQHSLV